MATSTMNLIRRLRHPSAAFAALVPCAATAAPTGGWGDAGEERARLRHAGRAAAHGLKIPGNAVLTVFRDEYAVRMRAASVPAGIEAPLRIYVTETADGTATLAYPPPSRVLAPDGSPALDESARELDPVCVRIVRAAAGG
jgi:hypothetical protein